MADALFNPTELTALLKQLGEDVRQGYVDKLVKNGRPTTENTLASTVRAYVEVKGTTYEVGLELQDYWKYVEEGTKPHWPPPPPSSAGLPSSRWSRDLTRTGASRRRSSWPSSSAAKSARSARRAPTT